MKSSPKGNNKILFSIWPQTLVNILYKLNMNIHVCKYVFKCIGVHFVKQYKINLHKFHKHPSTNMAIIIVIIIIIVVIYQNHSKLCHHHETHCCRLPPFEPSSRFFFFFLFLFLFFYFANVKQKIIAFFSFDLCSKPLIILFIMIFCKFSFPSPSPLLCSLDLSSLFPFIFGFLKFCVLFFFSIFSIRKGKPQKKKGEKWKTF